MQLLGSIMQIAGVAVLPRGDVPAFELIFAFRLVTCLCVDNTIYTHTHTHTHTHIYIIMDEDPIFSKIFGLSLTQQLVPRTASTNILNA